MKRPITPIKDFEEALEKADLTSKDYELIEYIRYTSVFSQPTLVKDLKLQSKPPVLTILCEICRKIGNLMPTHFDEVFAWSKSISEHNIIWEGHLICAEALTIDGIFLSPSSGTSLYDVLVVHKELFIGFE
tara:strand:+ start:320 stop:712 length:393 start_codon:yes stop_codon:yes gene_type:complete